MPPLSRPSRGEWIEIYPCSYKGPVVVGLTTYRVSGLKYDGKDLCKRYRLSHLVRGEWIRTACPSRSWGRQSKTQVYACVFCMIVRISRAPYGALFYSVFIVMGKSEEAISLFLAVSYSKKRLFCCPEKHDECRFLSYSFHKRYLLLMEGQI